jgi:hypothetical protein
MGRKLNRMAATYGIGRPAHQEGRTLMFRHNIPLGRILGIPIGLDYSWFVVFSLLTWMLAGSYYPAEFKDWPPLLYWPMGAVTAIMLFVSVLLYELGHSVEALRYKSPVRSITLFLFGGVAQIGAEPPSAIAEFLIAIAGPHQIAGPVDRRTRTVVPGRMEGHGFRRLLHSHAALLAGRQVGKRVLPLATGDSVSTASRPI